MDPALNTTNSNSVTPQEGVGKPKKKTYLIIIIAVGVIVLLAGLFYYLYNTYPNMPSVTLQEKGYKVTASLEFPKKEIPVDIYRNSSLIANLQNTGSHFIEYAPPGDHVYEFQFVTENLLGIEKNVQQTKELTIRELTTDELRQFFDFPSVNLTTSKYTVRLSYPELKKFSEIDIIKGGQNIKSLSATSTTEEFIEHVSPGKYIYEMVFRSEEFKNLDGFLRQDYEIEVEPIPPIISFIQPTPLYRGYSSDIEASVENASACKADLLLYPPGDSKKVGPTVLKTYKFNVGDGLDYFYPHDETWSWKEILFPKPTYINTTSYNMELKLACSDYYNSISTEKTVKFSPLQYVSPKSISISYYRDQSGTVYGNVSSNTWTDFDCRLLIGDQSNYTLDEKNFVLEGRHVYKFNIGSYNRNFLNVTAICKDSNGRSVTKISTYQAE